MTIGKKIWLILLLLSPVLAFAQTPTTQGTEFWLSFMKNGHHAVNTYQDKLTLIMSAKEGCQVTVTDASGLWSRTIAVGDHGVQVAQIPLELGYNEQTEGIANKGIHVMAEDTISLYIGNEAENSYDAANVLPIAALGTKYLIQSFQSIQNQASSHREKIRASFLIVAPEDQTEVRITPSVTVSGGYPAGQPYTIMLNRGQCYHAMSEDAGETYNQEGDFSGTMILSDKPVAVFNGNCLTAVPVGCMEGYDHVFEQAMPTDSWGNRFVVTRTRVHASETIGADIVKVTALDDQTHVMRNGNALFTLNAGQSDEFSLSEAYAYLEADKPVAVYLYQPSHGGDATFGDPSMVWISPVEQTLEEVTFSTFDVANLDDHFVNIVCYSENVSHMTLDGEQIGIAFSPVVTRQDESAQDAPELSYARYSINAGSHLLRCQGGFTAHVYGNGERIGYAYTVGSSAKQLTKQLYVDDVVSTEYPDGYWGCQDATIRFRFESNYEFDHVDWSFGDGAVAQGAEVQHAYGVAGGFDLQGVVYREVEDVVQPFDTVGLMIHVNAVYDTLVERTSCATSYTYLGVDYPVPGTHEITLSTIDGCDSIINLRLIQGDVEELGEERETRCEHYDWHGHDYTASGTYYDTIPDYTSDGCPGVYILHLTIVNPPEHPERTLESCEPIHWHDHYCDHTDDYSFTVDGTCEYDSILHFTLLPSLERAIDTTVCDLFVYNAPDGEKRYTESCVDSIRFSNESLCDSILILHLTVNHTPQLGQIHGITTLAVANSFWPGTYFYHIDSVGLNTEGIHWDFLEESPWRIQSFGASCMVTATTMETMDLRVWAEGEGGCYNESILTLNASGFGIGEEEANPVSLYPNPTDGMLFVSGEELLGLDVYNIDGQKLKSVLSGNGSAIEVDVRDLPPALYIVKIQMRTGNKTLLFSVL